MFLAKIEVDDALGDLLKNCDLSEGNKTTYLVCQLLCRLNLATFRVGSQTVRYMAAATFYFTSTAKLRRLVALASDEENEEEA